MDQCDTEICFICNADLCIEDTEKVTRGLPNLIRVSSERNDGKYEMLKKVDSILVHRKCREKYTLKRNDVLCYKDLGTLSKKSKYSPVKSKVRKSKELFDFKKLCIICGLDADKSNTRLSINQRKNISIIQSPTFKEKLSEMIAEHNDELGKAILRRISCDDLVAVQARYHRSCHKKVLSSYTRDTSDAKGRPKDVKISRQMELIFDYLSDSDDTQFTLTELIALLGKYIA